MSIGLFKFAKLLRVLFFVDLNRNRKIFQNITRLFKSVEFSGTLCILNKSCIQE